MAMATGRRRPPPPSTTTTHNIRADRDPRNGNPGGAAHPHPHPHPPPQQQPWRAANTSFSSKRRRGPPASSAADDLARTLRSVGPSATSVGGPPAEASHPDLHVSFPSDAGTAAIVHAHKAIALSDAPTARWLAEFTDYADPSQTTITSARGDRADLLALLAEAYNPSTLARAESQVFRNVWVGSTTTSSSSAAAVDEPAAAPPPPPFAAHRFLLGSRTAYFSALFGSPTGGRWADSGNSRFSVPIGSEELGVAVSFTEDPTAVAGFLRQFTGHGAASDRRDAVPTLVKRISQLLSAADFLQFEDLTVECVRQVYVLCHGFTCGCHACFEKGAAFRAVRLAEQWRLEGVMEDVTALMKESILTIMSLRAFHDLVPSSIRTALYEGMHAEHLTAGKIAQLVLFLDPLCPDATLGGDGGDSEPSFSGPPFLLRENLARLPAASHEPLAELDAAATSFCQTHLYSILAATADPSSLLTQPVSAGHIQALDSILARALSGMTPQTVTGQCAILDALYLDLTALLDALNESSVRRNPSPVERVEAVCKLAAAGRERCLRFIAKRWMNVDMERLSPGALADVAKLSGLSVDELRRLGWKDRKKHATRAGGGATDSLSTAAAAAKTAPRARSTQTSASPRPQKASSSTTVPAQRTRQPATASAERESSAGPNPAGSIAESGSSPADEASSSSRQMVADANEATGAVVPRAADSNGSGQRGRPSRIPVPSRGVRFG